MNASGHIDDVIAAYALGALDEDDVVRVEEHLQGCAVCRMDLRQMTEVVGLLPESLHPVQPPPHLKDRVVQAARTEARGADIQQLRAAAATETRTPVPFVPRAQRRSAARVISLLAAAAVVLFALGITVGQTLHKSGTTAEERYSQLIVSALTKGDRVTQLNPQRPGINAHMAIAVAPSGGTSLIVGPSSPPPTRKVYELWYITGKTAIGVGVFTPNKTEAKILPLSRSAHGYQTAAMTEETAPFGAKAPTRKPFVLAPIANL